MYNYFTLLDDLHDTLNMLRTIETCTIVFNQKAELIDINKAASDFLKIENIEDYRTRKLTLEIDNQFYRIIEDLKNGKTICNEKFELKRADNSCVFVNLKTTLFCGLKDVFIFQFSEIVSTCFL